MRKQLFNGDRRIVGSAGCILNHGRYFVSDRPAQFARFAQLHDRGCREQLLCDAMRNLLPESWVFSRRHRQAEALRPDQLLILHYADGNAGQAAVCNLSANPAVEEPLGAFTSG